MRSFSAVQLNLTCEVVLVACAVAVTGVRAGGKWERTGSPVAVAAAASFSVVFFLGGMLKVEGDDVLLWMFEWKLR